MPVLVWSDSFSVGVKEIDDQHQWIFTIINHLSDAIRKSADIASLPQIFQELIDYSNYHFGTEEKYFQEFHYAEREKHIAVHQVYRDKVHLLVNQYVQGKLDIAESLLDFLIDWWHGHIGGLDRHYTACFHEHGLY